MTLCTNRAIRSVYHPNQTCFYLRQPHNKTNCEIVRLNYNLTLLVYALHRITREHNIMQSSFSLPDTFLCHLTQLGIISVAGQDAQSYLQGKLTIDMEKLDESEAKLGCHCDFKGKTWSVFYATREQDHFDLLCHKESLPGSLSELKKYGVFSKADFLDCSENWTVLGGAGEPVETWIKAYFGSVPARQMQKITASGGYVFALVDPKPRYIMVLKPNVAQQLVDELKSELQEETVWEALDIQAGIANIQQATTNEFVPQMMNLQAMDAISFTKGCYMGQEVVARTKYLGKNKRAAFILSANDKVTSCAGDLLEMQIGENWRRAGTVLRAASLSDQTWLLAVLPNDLDMTQKLRLKDNPEQTFTLQPLPYEVA